MNFDTAQVLSCQACREDVYTEEAKIVIGAHLGPYQRIFVFHSDCWRIEAPRWEALLAFASAALVR